MSKLNSINHEQKLYVIEHGDGITCNGFDYLDKKAKAVARWRTGKNVAFGQVGTPEHFSACNIEIALGAEHARKTNTRCDAELTPELMGLEGKRVEVIYPPSEDYEPGKNKRRFWVGKSRGWMPCHIEIMTRRSSDGASVYFPPGSTVRVI